MARITPTCLFSVLLIPTMHCAPLYTKFELERVSGINAKKVIHQQQQQLKQKFANARLDLMHLKRFIGYATIGQKQMNGTNQLHSYLFNSPVQAVAGATDGDPNNPSTYKSSWAIPVSESDLSTLSPWLWHAIGKVERVMAQYPDSHELPIYQRWSRHLVLTIPFFGFQTFLDICSQVQQSQKQAALLLDNDPSVEQKSRFGWEVKKNMIVSKLTHNICLLQALITRHREFNEAIHQDNDIAISLLHTLDHNIHTLDQSQEMILSRLDTLAAQNAAIMSTCPLPPARTRYF
jgi:hypothetical protein